MHPSKVEAIISWPTPFTIHDIRSFHGLASFYRRFILNFSSIIVPLTECMKGGRFTWTSEAVKAFDILKAKVTEAPVLALPNFDEVFQLKPRHAKWVEFIQAFSFVVRHKVGSDNRVADALSRRHSLITTMQIRVHGFDSFRGLYCDDPDFRKIWSKCDNGPFQQFSKLNGYLFKGAWLCISFCSLCEAIILEGHAGGLAGHFARDKTLALLREQFYWPKMERVVNRLLERCCTCYIAKTHSSNASLYTPLSVPVALWEDICLDFVLEVGQFSKEGADQFEQIKELHRSVQEQIVRHNKQYKKHVDKRRKHVLYREGDLVWIHLRKERFSAGSFGKLKPRGDGPFRVLTKINDNAYKIELLGHYNVSATFNVVDLSTYKGDSDDEPDTGRVFFKEGRMM
uniref:Reverse transcriptase domain-containing protein n=1 Tax=Tanacetum cinerariifolium TaxID=118510 RepID=A0A6L2P615_TANCI|nr:reverse transcriptase domain-containing protein [Tanacetum cinerariifolium]